MAIQVTLWGAMNKLRGKVKCTQLRHIMMRKVYFSVPEPW